MVSYLPLVIPPAPFKGGLSAFPKV